jgi:hypothetical protein
MSKATTGQMMFLRSMEENQKRTKNKKKQKKFKDKYLGR